MSGFCSDLIGIIVSQRRERRREAAAKRRKWFSALTRVFIRRSARPDYIWAKLVDGT